MVRRLIERGLMFGNLVQVTSPVWIERYNRALEHLTGRTTDLTDFHIDISGYSPEVGDAFDDHLYLNHDGVNRQFILLTPEQATAPLLEAQFSTSRGILKQFIQQNEAQLFALTAKDAVTGELLNSVYSARTVDDLLDIRSIKVEADTTAGTVATAKELGAMIDRFQQEPQAWHNEALIADMIATAKQTGNIVRHPVVLDEMTFEQLDFWCARFGGLFVFRSTNPTTVIYAGKDPGLLPVDVTIPLRDTSSVARFLTDAGLVEPITSAPAADAAQALEQKMEMIVAAVATSNGITVRDERHLHSLARQLGPRLPEEWQGLAALRRWVTDGGSWPFITSDHAAYFYTLRAKQGPQQDLVNRLLAAYAPYDVLQNFICHKEAFYPAYAQWPEERRDFVANYLESNYLHKKSATRDMLFGRHSRAPETKEHIAGPWG